MDELPVRKIIRLQGYDYSENGAYFVTICAQNKSHVFDVGAAPCGRPNEPRALYNPEKWLIKIESKFNVNIDKYVIMPNHVHFIIFLSGGHMGPPLHEIISWFKTMTTNEYIRGVKAGLYPQFDKKLWQRSFHDRIIRGESEYQKIWNYIETNPARWHEDRYFAM
ncbi:MAG: transposase [Oscillospiraceae bacterium]|nr:transposase [Oscillospiraceae bacterium]